MATQQAQSHQDRYAWYYPEGAGYLHLRNIASGSQGSVALVMSCADRKLYIRKRGHMEKRDPTKFYSAYGCEEVSLYRICPTIPKLIDWKLYRPMRRSEPEHYKYTSTSTIWELCDVGDLSELVEYYEQKNTSVNKLFILSPPAPYQIPEAVIWKAFGQLIQAMNFIHHAHPPIAHVDLFTGNVFVRSCPDERMVDFCLGDFGKSSTLKMCQDRSYEYAKSNHMWNILNDFREIILIIKQMMMAQPYGWIQDSNGVRSNEHVHFQFDLLHQACTGMQVNNYDPVTFAESATFPKPQDITGTAARPRRLAPVRRYSSELFDTIRQLERRILLALGREQDRNFFTEQDGRASEAAVVRDWEYLGKAIEAKATQRMGRTSEVTYPSMDDTWDAALRSCRYNIDPNSVQEAILRNREKILDSHSRSVPSGPFRIAEVDPQNLRVTSISSETYNTFGSHSDQQNLSFAVTAWIRDDDDHSIPLDPTQTNGIDVSARLNRANL